MNRIIYSSEGAKNTGNVIITLGQFASNFQQKNLDNLMNIKSVWTQIQLC